MDPFIDTMLGFVVKGYTKVEYFVSFSPVAKIVIVRVFLAIVALKGWLIKQVDMNNAFLINF